MILFPYDCNGYKGMIVNDYANTGFCTTWTMASPKNQVPMNSLIPAILSPAEKSTGSQYTNRQADN